ncbi:hypothetical protein D3C84_1297090 [compost metagenome]
MQGNDNLAGRLHGNYVFQKAYKPLQYEELILDRIQDYNPYEQNQIISVFPERKSW